MKIAIFGKQYDSNYRTIVQQLFDTLCNRGCEVCVDALFLDMLSKDSCLQLPLSTPICDNNFVADMALSIGGDGTFLYTAACVGNKGIPILGINTGHLGFLADLSGSEAGEALDVILQGNYKVEKRSVLHVEIDGSPELWPYALNEVAVLKQDSASMISIKTTINDEYFNTYQADGLVIATPTGSTAYALSAGGPILVPQAANWVLAPVAPHSFTVRPLVVNDDVVITLQVTCRTGKFMLSCDGRSVQLRAGECVTLRKADFGIKVVKGYNHTFSKTLRNKLMWGIDKRD
ncbi:MAG: NAD kinase [Bacteroidaceae bacterium]|nr:NAD kinase [Bacteroidaceae bacterium]